MFRTILFGPGKPCVRAHWTLKATMGGFLNAGCFDTTTSPAPGTSVVFGESILDDNGLDNPAS